MVAHRSVIVIAAAAPIIGVRVPVWLGQCSARDPLLLLLPSAGATPATQSPVTAAVLVPLPQ